MYVCDIYTYIYSNLFLNDLAQNKRCSTGHEDINIFTKTQPSLKYTEYIILIDIF